MEFDDSKEFRNAGYVEAEPFGDDDEIADLDVLANAFELEQDSAVGVEVAAQEEAVPPTERVYDRLMQRFRMPAELPGAETPDVPDFGRRNDPEYSMRIHKYFPDVAFKRPAVFPDANAGQYTLDELINLALANNPLIAQAEAGVQQATGLAVQAGIYPNPIVGYQGDTIGSDSNRNFHGVFVTQTVKTAGKLDLARSAANVDLLNAQLTARKTRIEVITNVRDAYNAVLVATEAVIVADALSRFTSEVYKIQVDQLLGEQVASYEPAQLRALALQQRNALVLAENRYKSAWKQLATQIGVADLTPATLEGDAMDAVPELDYDAILARILSMHTDILAARNSQTQARIQLRLAEVTPVPDLLVYAAAQRDFLQVNFRGTSYNLQVGIPLPVFDRNVGGIRFAQGSLNRATQEINRVEYMLTQQFADAFERYSNSQVQIEIIRNRMIPDLVLAYRKIYVAYNAMGNRQEIGSVAFGDVVVAQQNLQTAIAQYIAALGAQWVALNDIAALAQVENINDLLADPNAPPGMNPRPVPAATEDEIPDIPAPAP
jgi:cobalt-zinc-cadmium efflux system outer membrane protein